MTGWIKLWRYLFKKPIWKNSTPEQKTVLITLLGMVNYESSQWEWEGKKFDLVPGQMITSIAKIQQRAGKGISPQNVRSSIARFEKLQFLTNRSTNAGRLISIINWEIYQGDDPDVNKVINRWVTGSQQTANKGATDEPTPIKEDKEDKEEQRTELDYSQLQKKTDRVCKTLSGHFKQFNFYAWRQEQINKQKHPEAIEECLKLLWEHRKTVQKGPRPYLTQLMKIKEFNPSEKKAIEEHKKRKQEELNYEGDILGGISKGDEP